MSTFQIIITVLAIGLSVFMLYCYETAQLVDESFKPLEPVKTFKDTTTTKLITYLILFFTVVYIVSSLLYPSCTLF